MCGICGAYNVDGAPADRDAVLRMRQALVHRGPDDEGSFFDGPAGLGFRRLSILDLEGGHQPMGLEDARLTLVFNGEIYNHPALRAELEASGESFKTRSDTETILRLYARRGAAAFERLDGMFAVGVWDGRRKELVLARDAIGIKPLYYRFDGKSLIFASELRALLAAGLDPALDPEAVADYLAYGKAHAPRTVFREVLKLPPGHFLALNAQGLRLERYWKPPRQVSSGKPDVRESAERLDAVLSESVKGAMLSDVPLGAFLSGGLDSSLVTAYMVRHSGAKKVQTFSVGFEGASGGVDESAWARQAAAHLGTDHHELILPARVLDRLEESIDLLDEPIADSAILPTFFLAKHARQKVKVALTGEGADELFAGYNRHKAAWINQKLKGLPAVGRLLAAPIARRLGKGEVFGRLPYADARDWAEATASSTPEALRAVLTPEFWDASRRGGAMDWLKDFGAMDDLNDALDFDLRTTMVDSLLMKVDKSTMKASLEARVPYLNKPVVEFALGLPASFKIRNFKGKYLLRRVASKYLPRRLVWRRKHGFIVPWEHWVRDPSNETLRGLLAGASPALREVFDLGRLELFWSELCRGSRQVEAGLFFRIAIFGLWLDSLKKRRLVAP